MMLSGPRLSALAGAALLAGASLPPPEAAAQQATSGLVYSQPLAPQALMQVQERLRQLGAYTGRVDGVWGPDSQQALERFQQSRGLQVSGQLNQATAATLGVNPVELLAARMPMAMVRSSMRGSCRRPLRCAQVFTYCMSWIVGTCSAK